MLKTFLTQLATRYLERRGYMVRSPYLTVEDMNNKPIVQGCIFLSKREMQEFRDLLTPDVMNDYAAGRLAEDPMHWAGYEVYAHKSKNERDWEHFGHGSSTWSAGPIKRTTATT